MMAIGLIFCLVIMWISTLSGPHVYANEHRVERQLRKSLCRSISGMCVWKRFTCPSSKPRSTGVGAPYCQRGRRYCYPEPDPYNCEHWCYPSTDWPYTCSNYCNGNLQSPIDICTGSTISEPGSLSFSTSYSDPIPKITIKNNGHTVHASWTGGNPRRIFISGGGLNGIYVLKQFHFHWGCKNNRGSEHTVDGTRYSMELHMVHHNVEDENKLAVFGIFFDVGPFSDGFIEPITDNLQDIVVPGSEKEIVFNVALIDLIPSIRTSYRYNGSLTIPPCNENVFWSVFSTSKIISEVQAEKFRMLMKQDGNNLCDNYRGIQPLNGRVVNKYYP